MTAKGTCHSCNGTGKVFRYIGTDEDNYPKYGEIKCPACNGGGYVDMAELFVVPRAMVKDDFFVSTLYTEREQNRLRKLIEEERKFFDKIK